MSNIQQLIQHYLDCFLVGPTLIVSVTVVDGLLVASLLYLKHAVDAT